MHIIYKLAFPWLSNGSIATNKPAAKKRAPLVYTGAVVSRFANIATSGCIMSVAVGRVYERGLTAMIPNTRFDVAVKAFPVPRSFVGNISGVYA